MTAMEPVRVWERLGLSRSLSTVEDAADFLLNKWPAEFVDTDLHRVARQVGVEVDDGETPVRSFRDLFLAAAKEAGILAPPMEMPTRKLPGHIARPWAMSKKKPKRRR